MAMEKDAAELKEASGFLQHKASPKQGRKAAAAKAAAGAPGPSPGGAPAPSVPTMPDVQVFITFSPGRKIGKGRSTMVEVAFLDTPSNAVDDVAAAKPFLDWMTKTGLFTHEVGQGLKEVT